MDGKKDVLHLRIAYLRKPHVMILGVQPAFFRKGEGGVESPCQMGCGSSFVNMNHYWETKFASYFTIIYYDLHWTKGRLDQWSIGPKVHWSIGPLDHWTIGPCVHWSIGPLVPWSSGPLLHWSIGPLVHWSIGPKVHWSKGPLVHLSIVPLVHLTTGPLVYWLNVKCQMSNSNIKCQKSNVKCQ